jgi:hypothetical protein
VALYIEVASEFHALIGRNLRERAGGRTAFQEHVEIHSGCAAAAQSLNPFGKEHSIMRAETEKLVEDIKRSIGLLRRHL